MRSDSFLKHPAVVASLRRFWPFLKDNCSAQPQSDRISQGIFPGYTAEGDHQNTQEIVMLTTLRLLTVQFVGVPAGFEVGRCDRHATRLRLCDSVVVVTAEPGGLFPIDVTEGVVL